MASLALSGVVATLLGAVGCATLHVAPPEVQLAARRTTVLRARVAVSLAGPRGRARATVLLACSRPGALRLEVPGPGGARLIVVTQGGQLTALFPSERAVFTGRAAASDVEAVLGVALEPDEIMDLLLGTPAARLRETRVDWGPRFPRRVHTRLDEGTTLHLRLAAVEAPDALPPDVFAPPPHVGYRAIDAREARELGGR